MNRVSALKSDAPVAMRPWGGSTIAHHAATGLQSHVQPILTPFPCVLAVDHKREKNENRPPEMIRERLTYECPPAISALAASFSQRFRI